jgi:predicted DNA-binding transcriptional regulator AlpA
LLTLPAVTRPGARISGQLASESWSAGAAPRPAAPSRHEIPADVPGMTHTTPAAPQQPRPIDFFCLSPDTLVDENLLSAGTGIAVSTIRNWRSARTGPRVVRLGGVVRYRVSDITAWIDACAAESSSEPALS